MIKSYIVTFETVGHCGICDQIDTSTSSGDGETGVDTADMVVGDKYKNSIVTLPWKVQQRCHHLLAKMSSRIGTQINGWG